MSLNFIFFIIIFIKIKCELMFVAEIYRHGAREKIYGNIT